jgi:hypothetical protein
MVPTTHEYQQGLMVAPYMSSMSHKFGGEPKFQSKKITLNVNEGGVGGVNHTPHMVKPLVIISLSFESYVTFVMNLKP